MAPIQLQLYTKPDCPLCDEAKAVLEKISHRFPIEVEEIDITANLGLFTKYKYLIPALEMDGKRICIHRIDTGRLKRKLMWERIRRYFSG